MTACSDHVRTRYRRRSEKEVAISGGLEVSVYAVVGDRIGKFEVSLTIWSGPISRGIFNAGTGPSSSWQWQVEVTGPPSYRTDHRIYPLNRTATNLQMEARITYSINFDDQRDGRDDILLVCDLLVHGEMAHIGFRAGRCRKVSLCD